MDLKNKELNNYFKTHKFVLRLLGISLNENETVYYKIYSTILLIIVGAYPFLGLGDAFKHDFDVVMEIVVYLFAMFLGLVKGFVILTNRKKFATMLDKLEQKPFVANRARGGNEESKLIQEFIAINETQTKIYLIGTAICVLGSILLTLIQRIKSSNYEDWQFTYGPFTVINVTYSPNYEIAWSYQNFGVSCLACYFTTVDVMIAGILCNIYYQFKILQNCLRLIIKKSSRHITQEAVANPTIDVVNRTIPSIIRWRYLHRFLKEIINYHLEIINYTKDLEKLLNILILTVFLSTLGMLGSMIYRASSISIQDVRMVRKLIELVLTSLQVLMMCFWGEQIMSESINVGKAAYEADFVGADLRFQKALKIIILRSQTPVKLTAGKFSNVCLITFTWILRTSYSAFMVLRRKNL